jgi:hypothetical protein
MKSKWLLANGIWSPHPDLISGSPRGPFVVVIDSKDRPHHLNALLIERALLKNGHHQAKPRRLS